MNNWERRVLGFLLDVRTIGVLAQMAIIAVVIMVAVTMGRNFTSHADKLGDAQFICRDGTFSYRCAFDFMANEAGFDISDTLLEYVNTDSYWWAIANGIVNTFRVGLLSIVAMTVLGVITAIARISNNWLLSRLALIYVEIVRNTPILITLLLIYFAVILALPDVKEAFQPFGLDIYFTNRGLLFPWPRLMSGAPIWFVFLLLGAIQFQLVWLYLGRMEQRTGKAIDRVPYALIGFVLIAVAGWLIASNVSNNEALLVSQTNRIDEVDDIEKVVLGRAGLNHTEALATLSTDEVNEIAYSLCALRDSPSEYNLANQLRRLNLPYVVHRFSTPEKAMASLLEGSCEGFVAPRRTLLGALNQLENSSGYRLLPVKESPLVISVPRLEKFNIVGGILFKGEFFALFLGLTIFYAGGFSEVVRAGILSVSLGQSDAARALGLSETQRIQLVVLPQALRVIIPPMISAYLSLMKDTSLGVAVAFPEMYILAQILMNQSGRAVQIMFIIMVVYLSISLFFSVVLNKYNQHILRHGHAW